MAKKFKTGKFCSRFAFTICANQLTEKRPRKPETGIKDGFEEMEHELPLGTFRPEKQDYLFRSSVDPEKISTEATRKVVNSQCEGLYNVHSRHDRLLFIMF